MARAHAHLHSDVVQERDENPLRSAGREPFTSYQRVAHTHYARVAHTICVGTRTSRRPVTHLGPVVHEERQESEPRLDVRCGGKPRTARRGHPRVHLRQHQLHQLLVERAVAPLTPEPRVARLADLLHLTPQRERPLPVGGSVAACVPPRRRRKPISVKRCNHCVSAESKSDGRLLTLPFATPADFPRHECTPYRGLHVRHTRVALSCLQKPFSVAPCQTLFVRFAVSTSKQQTFNS
jgi:hypothetical protein